MINSADSSLTNDLEDLKESEFDQEEIKEQRDLECTEDKNEEYIQTLTSFTFS